SKQFEGGVEPSKGQWQRIALARTLFKNGEIVILDEPTSNVDPKAEEEIFDKVIDLTRQKLLILISHRFSTVRRADRIFVIDKGKIVEEGGHKELLAKKGLYAELFKLQAKGYQ
ncbi:MAG: ABC transporter related protein, partial [Microgenomates group bacterium GW2011_GWA2_44_7]